MTNIISVILMCATMTVGAAAAPASNCNNAAYRHANPTKCISNKSSGGNTLILGAGAGVIAGAGVLLATMMGGGDNNTQPHTPDQPRASTPAPIYDTVGWTDPIALTNAMGGAAYRENFDHFNEIRLGYAHARGFTGRGSNIAVLDDMDGLHGVAVTYTIGHAIAPDAKITTYDITDNGREFASYANIGKIIASSDARIFNASWGIPTYRNIDAADIHNRTQLSNLTDAGFINQIIDTAIKNDAIFVWAAGNTESGGTPQSNAISALPRVADEMTGHFVNVVAWDTERGQLADFSNECGVTMNWCIAAPGVRIDTGDYLMSGTSFAAPMVSGAIAVIQQAWPFMKAAEITQLLFETARDLGELGVDAQTGHGMLDLERATRPVGAPLVPIGDVMRPLGIATVDGVIADAIATSGDLEFSFFDSFGRDFKTSLGQNVRTVRRGVAFDRLRDIDTPAIIDTENIRFGFTQNTLIRSDGFLAARGGNMSSFFGVQDNYTIGNVFLDAGISIGFERPTPEQNSFVNNFSNIYTISANVGAKYGNWRASFGTTNAVLGGTMSIRLPAGKTAGGDIMFADYDLDLAVRPALEYSIGYKFITATYVDNPVARDEFFLLAKHRFIF